MQGINVAYDEQEKRGCSNSSLTATAVVLAVLGFLGDDGWVAVLLGWIRWPILASFVILGLGVFYRVGPSRRAAEWRWLSPGAILACALWLGASLGFSFYVSNFGTYNETFGALAGVVVLLLWFWTSALIVLLGAEVKGEIEAQTECDSTVGPDRQMGRRSAVKADILGAARDEAE